MSEKPVYRISGIGYCPRALSAEHLGYAREEAPKYLMTAAREGNRHEIWIKEDLAQEGLSVVAEQKEVGIELSNALMIGHIDGMIYRNNDVDSMLEIKSMSAYEFDRWYKGNFEEFPHYLDQITCYMGATGISKALYIVKNRSSGYIDRKTIYFVPERLEFLKKKIQTVEEYVLRKELYPAEYLPESLQCKRCNFKELCVPQVKDFKAVPNDLLLKATNEYRKGKLLEEEGLKLIEDAKVVLMEQTNASGEKKWRFNQLSVTKVDVKAGVSYSKANLLKVFTEEQLAPAAEIKTGYSFLRIDDLNKE